MMIFFEFQVLQVKLRNVTVVFGEWWSTLWCLAWYYFCFDDGDEETRAKSEWHFQTNSLSESG